GVPVQPLQLRLLHRAALPELGANRRVRHTALGSDAAGRSGRPQCAGQVIGQVDRDQPLPLLFFRARILGDRTASPRDGSALPPLYQFARARGTRGTSVWDFTRSMTEIMVA